MVKICSMHYYGRKQQKIIQRDWNMYLLSYGNPTIGKVFLLFLSLSFVSTTASAINICQNDSIIDSNVIIEDCYIASNIRGQQPGGGVIRFANKEQSTCKISDTEYQNSYVGDWESSEQNQSNKLNTACISKDGKHLHRTGVFDPSFSISSTLEFKGNKSDRPKRYKVTYSSIPGNLNWLPENRSMIKLVKSANTARTTSLNWNKFTVYGAPEIKSIIFNGVKEDNVSEFPVSIDASLSTLTASSNPKLAKSGELELIVENKYGESASIFVDVTFFTYKDDPSVLSLKMELSLNRKLIADELFLRAGDTPLFTSECSDQSSKKKARALEKKNKHRIEKFCEIFEKYEEANKDLPNCGVNGKNKNEVDCTAMTEAQLATLKLIRSDIAYRLILLRNNVPFLGGYRSLKQTTPHHELIKLQSLEKRMSELVDKIRDVQWRSTDLQIKSAETEAGRAYSMGQVKSQELTTAVTEIMAVNHDSAIASNKQHLQTLAAHITDLGKRATKLEKEQDALQARAGSLIQQGIAAATGMPIQEVEMLASGDIEGAVEKYVVKEVSKKGSELAKKFAEKNEMVQSVNRAYEEFKKTEEEIRAVVDDVKKIPRELKTARDELRRKLLQANDTVKKLHDEIGSNILKNFAGKQGKKMRSEVARMVEELKPIGLRIEAAHNKMMSEGYPEKLRKSYEEGLQLVSQQVTASEEEWKNIREGLIDDVKAVLMDHEKRFLSIRLVQIARSKAVKGRAGLKYFNGLISMYPELVDGSNGQFLEMVLDNYDGNSEDKNTIYALRKAIIEGVEAYGDNRRNRPDVFYNTKERMFVFRIGLKIDQEESYLRLEFKKVIEALLEDFDEAKSDLPSNEEMAAFLHHTKDILEKEHLFVLKNSMKGPGEFAKQMQKTMGDNRKELEQAWDKLNDVEDSIFNHKDVLQESRNTVASILAMKNYEDMQEPLPPLKSPTQVPLDEKGSNSLSPEANAALGAALNYAFPGAGIALQLGQTFASMDANNDLLAEIEKESVRAIAEYQQTQKAIKKATIDSAIAKKEQERAEALAEAAEAQLKQFDVVMQIALNEKMELRELLSMYRPYFFYLSEMMRERFNAFDRSLAIWSHGKPSQGFFAKKIMEDPRNARLALDSEIHLFDWLNREREATKTDPYYLFNHWQQIITLAETYCSDFGCKPGDSKLGKIGATVPVSLIQDLGGMTATEKFKDWRSSNNRSRNFTFSVNLNGMENLIPRDFLNVRLIDINIVPVTNRGKRLMGNMVNVRHTGSARIATYDRQKGKLVMTEENLLPSKYMPPNNHQTFNLTKLAERFQSQFNLNSLLALRGFEGYGALGSYEFSIVDTPDIDKVEDFEIQFAYVYQEAEDITGEEDYLNQVNASCRDDETRRMQDIYKEESVQNVMNETAKVHSCIPKMQIQFTAFKVNEKTGKVTCGNDEGIVMHISDTNHMSILRSVLVDENQEGVLKCANIFKSEERVTETYDLSNLAAQRPRCTLVEILNAAGNKTSKKAKCFGEQL